MITLTQEQQDRLVRKKELKLNWLAGIVLCLLVAFIVIIGPGALKDVVMFTAAFIVKWAVTRLWYARKLSPAGPAR